MNPPPGSLTAPLRLTSTAPWTISMKSRPTAPSRIRSCRGQIDQSSDARDLRKLLLAAMRKQRHFRGSILPSLRSIAILRHPRRDPAGSEEAPLARNTLELVAATILEHELRPRDQILDGARDEHLTGLRVRGNPRPNVHGNPCDLSIDEVAFARVQAGADLETEFRSQNGAERRQGADRCGGQHHCDLGTKPTHSATIMLGLLPDPDTSAASIAQALSP
jgi:hypothetical protein